MAAETWRLVLYVGDGPTSRAALEIARRLCAERLNGRFTCDVIDINQNPGMAHKHNILAVPTLVRELPLPVKRLVGYISDLDVLARALDIK